MFLDTTKHYGDIEDIASIIITRKHSAESAILDYLQLCVTFTSFDNVGIQ